LISSNLSIQDDIEDDPFGKMTPDGRLFGEKPGEDSFFAEI
jgi:hypothetical protein